MQRGQIDYACLCCRLGRYEDAETRLKQAVKYADDSQSSRTPEEITLSFVKALEVTSYIASPLCRTAKFQRKEEDRLLHA